MSVHRRLLPGVFVGSTAIAEGFLTRTQLRRRSYRRLAQGVYADPGLPFDHLLRCRGVALLLPLGAAIGGHSAAAWYGAPFAATNDQVTVVCPEEVRWRGPREAAVHHTVLQPSDVDLLDDVPVTTALRTAWDVSTLEPLTTAVAALDAMVAAKHLTTGDLAAMADRGAGRWGVTRVRRAVPLVDPRAESPQESRLRVLLALAGLAPVPQFEVVDDGGFVARVDLAFPDVRLAIEYEGGHHFVEDQIARDDERLERLRAAGWRVVRVSAADLRDLDALLRRIRAALAAG
ncbi:endonuclease domain-containing protein [Geodermatophilus amargosae]|uniref:endonuclease domain-containing protein n=1 Tax=Geodermatophilus amargosae TaxID=1296565 RepID=UPI0034DE6EF9